MSKNEIEPFGVSIGMNQAGYLRAWSDESSVMLVLSPKIEKEEPQKVHPIVMMNQIEEILKKRERSAPLSINSCVKEILHLIYPEEAWKTEEKALIIKKADELAQQLEKVKEESHPNIRRRSNQQ